MPSLYDSASLLMIPSARKNGKLYSIKPTDGSGDFTFSRALGSFEFTASNLIQGVASNNPLLDQRLQTCPISLLEPEAEQLIRYTNDFTQWTADGIAVTSNYASSPNGTTNADRLQGGGTITGEGFNTTLGNTHLVSVFIKSNTTPLTVQLYKNGDVTDTEDFAVTTEWKWFTHRFTATSDQECGFILPSGADVSIYEANLIKSEYILNPIDNDGTAPTATKPVDAITEKALSTFDSDLSSFTLGLKFVNGGEDFENDEVFTLPVGFGYTPPFTIKKSRFSGKHYPANFNLRTHAGVTATQTIYVDKDAVGLNNGTSWANAYTTIQSAILAVNQPTTIYIAAGQYDYDNSTKSAQIPAYDVEIIGVGGMVVNTPNQWSDAGTWTASGTAYKATFPNDLNNVVDFGVLDANGDPYPLEPQSSVAAVQSDGGWYWDGVDLYIRTSDDRVPDSNLELYRGQIAGGEFAGINVRGSNYTVYCENIDSRGWRADYRTRDLSGVSTGLNVYLNNCKGYRTIWPYADEIMVFDSEFRAIMPAEDVLNYDGNAGAGAQSVVEYRTDIRMINPAWATGGSSSQCSTTHNNVNTLRIDCSYKNAYGQNIADVSGSDTVLIDCVSANSQAPSQIGYFIGTGSGGNMWLYNCSSTDDTVAIQVGDAASTAYYYNLTTNGSLDAGAGTITEIFTSGDAADNTVQKVFAPTGGIHVETAIGGGFKVYYSGEGEYITEVGAYHIVIVNDGGTIRQYNDGVLVGTSTHTYDYSSQTFGTGATGGKAPARLAQLYFANGALTASEALALSNS